MKKCVVCNREATRSLSVEGRERPVCAYCFEIVDDTLTDLDKGYMVGTPNIQYYGTEAQYQELLGVVKERVENSVRPREDVSLCAAARTQIDRIMSNLPGYYVFSIQANAFVSGPWASEEEARADVVIPLRRES